MILVVVGTQLPFDRMTRAVDAWAGLRGRNDVYCQIGPTPWRPAHVQWSEFMRPEEYAERFARATLLVAHAGMGSIIGALEAGKPIVIVPRRASLGEHRNEHQMATAAKFRGRRGVYVADTEAELPGLLDQAGDLPGGEPIGRDASPELIERVRGFIWSE